MSIERLDRALAAQRSRGGRGLAPYITAGDGGLATTLAVLHALARGGAACVELGVPFSDPIADGPVLQAAAERALRVHTNLEGIFDLVRRFRFESKGGPGESLPILLFSYANPLLRRGWKAAARAAEAAGLDGWLVPDLPLEESGVMREAALDAGLAPIFFVAPTTKLERAKAAAEASRGFLYAIGRFGVTGSRGSLDPRALEFLATLRSKIELPLAVGFGISTAEQVRAVWAHAELAIVGSALVERIVRASEACDEPKERATASAQAAADFLAELLHAPSPLS